MKTIAEPDVRDEPDNAARADAHPTGTSAVRELLAAHVAVRRRRGVIRAAGWAAGFALFWMTCWGIVDRLHPLGQIVRWGLFVGLGGGVALILARPVRQWLSTTIDWSAAAADVERVHLSLAERLQTVVTQSLAPPAARASADMLARLSLQLRDELTRCGACGKPPVDWRSVSPWLGVAAILCGFTLLPAGGLHDGRRLFARQLLPFADLPPVTTTRLWLEPYSDVVAEGSTMKIVAGVERSGGADLVLHVRRQGGAATSARMARAGDGRFSSVTTPADRDFEFHVACGDASTPPAKVTVTRLPTAEDIEVAYAYPAHLRRTPKSPAAGGAIVAQAGTRCRVTFTSSAASVGARLEIVSGSRKNYVDATRTGRPDAWSAAVDVVGEATYSIRLRGERGVTWASKPYPIRAIVDTRPTAAFLVPPIGLRIAPAGSIALPLAASDDDAIAATTATLHPANGPSAPLGVTVVRANGTSLTGFVTIDLGGTTVKSGEVVVVHFSATDTAGANAPAGPVRLLVSPSPTDPLAWRRRIHLGRFERACEDLRRALAEASRVLGSVPRDAERLTTAVGPRLSESAGFARACARALLDMMPAASTPREADELAGLTDSAGLLGSALARFNDGLESASWESALSAVREGLDRAADLKGAGVHLRTRETAGEFLAVRAAIEAASLKTADAAARGSDSESRQAFDDAMAALEQSSGEMVAALGLASRDADHEGSVRRLVLSADASLRRYARPDLADAARRWATGDSTALDDRLGWASRAESLRPDADVARALDIRTAAAAVRRIDAGAVAGASSDVRGQFVAALSVVLTDHGPAESGLPTPHSEEALARRTIARNSLRHWAGDQQTPDSITATSPAGVAWPPFALAPHGLQGVNDPMHDMPPAKQTPILSGKVENDPTLRNSLRLYFEALRRRQSGAGD